ncbi:MAG: anthranilate phosphoribosyltransferase [Candidatus Dormibacteria bacterium]
MADDGGVMRGALERLVEGGDLDTDGARGVMDTIMDGRAGPAQIAAVLVALRMKGETVDEIHGMALSMREHATRVELPVDAVDTCGTGGDGSGTFNISTAAALVVAGAGCPVVKHGNRAASSRCGSADVLEVMGVAIALPPESVRRCVVEAGIGFMFARTYHPAMGHAASARGELGIRTVFNILGPLTNPARVRHQVVGTGDPMVAPLLAEVLRRLGHRHALVVTGPEGLDEIGLSGPTRCYEVSASGISEITLHPAAVGIEPAPLSALRGGSAEDNARRIHEVLAGAPGPPRDVVLLNAGAALVAADRAETLSEGMEMARESIDTGEAGRRLEALIALSREESGSAGGGGGPASAQPSRPRAAQGRLASPDTAAAAREVTSSAPEDGGPG